MSDSITINLTQPSTPVTINVTDRAGAGVWGTITGTLSSQTDLQSALDAKAASSHTHSATDITSGTLDPARFSVDTPSNGQVLTWQTGGTAVWEDSAAAATWGGITGTLSSQTDLQIALDAKLSLAGGTITGDLTVNGESDLGSLTIVSAPSDWGAQVDISTYEGTTAGDSSITVETLTRYLYAPVAGSDCVVYLPESPTTGDTVRIEVENDDTATSAACKIYAQDIPTYTLVSTVAAGTTKRLIITWTGSAWSVSEFTTDAARIESGSPVELHAESLTLNNGTSASTLLIYGSDNGAGVYTRAKLEHATSGDLTISTEANGATAGLVSIKDRLTVGSAQVTVAGANLAISDAANYRVLFGNKADLGGYWSKGWRFASDMGIAWGASTAVTYNTAQDVGLFRASSGTLRIAALSGSPISDNGDGALQLGNLTASGTVTAGSYTAAQLAALTPAAGARAFCTDSDTVASGNFGNTFGGLSTNFVPVYYDGINWRIG